MRATISNTLFWLTLGICVGVAAPAWPALGLAALCLAASVVLRVRDRLDT